jgi:hypothetical protein
MAYVRYNEPMKSKVLSQINPHLRDAAKAAQRRVRSVASSTAIETGESIRSIEEKINRLPSVRTRVTLA